MIYTFLLYSALKSFKVPSSNEVHQIGTFSCLKPSDKT